ncbi:hypothetical protein FB567DRAFT_592499 [Paraphoma chrysanthemicola]|uniref:Uncharacterized protein n=1 Tax=Paraphoma chrysanthemicola TaxID=798071 RepID=A0A8K0R9A3_9PLEO|nr:hypothetical protein FB567DRAFT_592499 [Paraphoma chrysanthemicola]
MASMRMGYSLAIINVPKPSQAMGSFPEWITTKGAQIHFLLHATRDRQVTDARDKIYGLLGLTHLPLSPDAARQFDYKLPPVNYTSTILEVYFKATNSCLDGGRGLLRLDFLRDAGYIPEAIRKLCRRNASDISDVGNTEQGRWPTWVPDWSLNIQNSRIHGRARPLCQSWSYLRSNCAEKDVVTYWRHEMPDGTTHGPCLSGQGIVLLTIAETFSKNAKDCLRQHLQGHETYPFGELYYRDLISALPNLPVVVPEISSDLEDTSEANEFSRRRRQTPHDLRKEKPFLE